ETRRLRIDSVIGLYVALLERAGLLGPGLPAQDQHKLSAARRGKYAGEDGMKRHLLPLIGLLTSVMLAPLSGEALAAAKKPQASKPAHHAGKSDSSARHQNTAHKGGKKSRVAARDKAKPAPKDTSRPPDAPPLTGDLALIRDAIDLAR